MLKRKSPLLVGSGCRETPSTNFADWVVKIWPSRIVSKASFEGRETFLYSLKYNGGLSKHINFNLEFVFHFVRCQEKSLGNQG